MARIILAVFIFAAPLILSGCLVRTAAGVAGNVAEGAVNVTGAAVGAVTPDGDKKEKKKSKKNKDKKSDREEKDD